MSKDEYLPILEKARQFALDGDYQSSLTYYEESKLIIERERSQMKSPQTKRVIL